MGLPGCGSIVSFIVKVLKNMRLYLHLHKHTNASMGTHPSTHPHICTQVPPEIGLLNNLQELDLSANLLRTIPSEIGDLQALHFLNLAENRLKELPDTMGDLG